MSDRMSEYIYIYTYSRYVKLCVLTCPDMSWRGSLEQPYPSHRACVSFSSSFKETHHYSSWSFCWGGSPRIVCSGGNIHTEQFVHLCGCSKLKVVGVQPPLAMTDGSQKLQIFRWEHAFSGFTIYPSIFLTMWASHLNYIQYRFI